MRIGRVLKELKDTQMLQFEKNTGEVKSRNLYKGLGLAGIVVLLIVAIIAMTTGGNKAEVGYPAPIHTSI